MKTEAIVLYKILKDVHGETPADTIMEYLEEGMDIRINQHIDLRLMGVATKEHAVQLRNELKEEIVIVHIELVKEIADVRDKLKNEIVAIRIEFKNEIIAVRLELKSEIAEVRDKLMAEISALRMEFKSEITALKDELKHDIMECNIKIANLESKMLDMKSELIKWMFVFWIAQVATIFGLAMFFLNRS